MNDKLFEAFCLGVDYGQLLCEEERESEETVNALCGHLNSKKHSMPSNQIERRQLRSDKWFEEKRKAKKLFLKLYEKEI
jgi:hypothetical protein